MAEEEVQNMMDDDELEEARLRKVTSRQKVMETVERELEKLLDSGEQTIKCCFQKDEDMTEYHAIDMDLQDGDIVEMETSRYTYLRRKLPSNFRRVSSETAATKEIRQMTREEMGFKESK